jgi:hypothetical protein
MEEQIPTDLLRLWKITEKLPSQVNTWNSYFDSIGLNLLFPLKNNGYWCTPINSVTFATTGGDGVHYSFLQKGGEYTNESPIVMTVPMGFDKEPNLIVGKNLHEFLSLGSKFGYFSLEQLMYDKNTVKEIEKNIFPEYFEDEEKRLLTQINDEFYLSAWKEVDSRLKELQSEFGNLIKLPPQTP